MTNSPSPPLATPSLSEYAWRTLGPRECLIDALINGAIAWLVFWTPEPVPLLGWRSLLIVCGPMCFLLPGLTTFFGYMNGVLSRRRGQAGSALPPGVSWMRRAAFAGWQAAVLFGTVNLVIMILAGTRFPEFTLGKWGAVLVVALYAGVLGYVLHARAAVQAETLSGDLLRSIGDAT